ncbi:23S rRNA pseudouridine1911/1915/1917 synthase [Strigomonas culicis]|nr:23S rRNA pseudouridine1911/1915/1917 synthase [Strigomonas culicis]|eukprot:EPY34209.1 23S rRNA pseudouridine1911/1915/1917 synthase [Strigomonas culicis]
MLRLLLKYPVDPSVLLLPDRTLFLSWCERHFGNSPHPAERAAAVRQFVRETYLQPRQRTIDALNRWCLTDVGREWFQFCLAPVTVTRRDDGSTPADSVLEAWHQTCERIAMLDARKNLVEHRLLHQYTFFLSQGYISATDESFPYFLDECGESHSSAERPAQICFTVRPPADDRDSLLAALRRLAPRCAYWCALLDHVEDHVSCTVCPWGDVRVAVTLPPAHECCAVARAALSQAEASEPSPFPVLLEDAHVVVCAKPAGVATSRHALSCTQLGRPTCDLISTQLAKTGGELRRRVFRQGQVHRLDTGTSGSIVMAKTDAAADSLRHQMGTSARLTFIPKLYRALCVVVENDLTNVPLKGEIKDHGDARVRTQYRVVQFFSSSRIALVECRIQQGKKHQIRRHLASIGLPLCGDVDHGGAACCQSLFRRVALHALAVSFIHPDTGLKTTVLSPVPSDFRDALATLRQQEPGSEGKRSSLMMASGKRV